MLSGSGRERSTAWLEQDGARDRRVLGLDLGGANLKVATAAGHWMCVPFSLWLRPHDLAQRLVWLAKQMPACQAWAVTMTGEMADVFLDRGEGVCNLVGQTIAAAEGVGIDDVAFYSVDGRFVSDREALADPDAVASANWHALASWIANWVDSPSLLIDVGSTTTDIIPINAGRVATDSRTDFDRLVSGQLVYLGGGRTPVCSLMQSLPLQGLEVPLMREVFATTDDCALVLGLAEEDAGDPTTSDGRPRTVAAAVNRLARMIGLDHRRLALDSARPLAAAVIAAAADKIGPAIQQQRCCYGRHWILSGHAAEYFLPGLLADRDSPVITRLSERLGPQLSRVAPAYACAALRQRRDLVQTGQGS